MQETDDLIPFISKTKLKAEADAQQVLGKKLIGLPKNKLIKLNLPETLYDAVIEASRLKSNGAKRRQLQYIGRLMRDVDTALIADQFARWEGHHHEESARFHALEVWRDQLINEASTSQSNALQKFVTQYPNAEIQQLRNLSRNAHKELLAQKSPKNSRELFKLIRQIIEDAKQLSNESIE
jgi:ribosome-associated protein